MAGIPRDLRTSRPTGAESRRLDEAVRTYWGELAWTCQLCGQPIPADVPRSHPLAWTKDHILTIRQGGGNDLANLQPAHDRCNKRKGHGQHRRRRPAAAPQLRTSRDW